MFPIHKYDESIFKCEFFLFKLSSQYLLWIYWKLFLANTAEATIMSKIVVNRVAKAWDFFISFFASLVEIA